MRPSPFLLRPAVLAASLVGVAAGAGLYTFDAAEGTSYLSSDPRACVNCHVMRDVYDAWQKGSHHAAATCNDCHVPQDFLGKYLIKTKQGWRHSKGFTLQDFPEPIRATAESRRVIDANCVRCHEELVHRLAPHAPGRTPPLDCTRCHVVVGHDARR